MTRSFHKTKETPHHSYTNSAGAVKTSPVKIKKQGHGGKGSWGSTRDEIADARQLVEEGELPPSSSPEREKSMRKLSISSSTSSETSTTGNASLSISNQGEKILEEESEWVDEPDSKLKEEGAVVGSTSKA